SLEDGVSFFMAELRRLKQIVDLAEQPRTAGQARLFFLLDEILQGTNSAERQIAVRRVIARLLGAGAVGAISTHDLSLPAARELHDACKAVHFREQFVPDAAGRQRMTFDYHLHEGLAQTTNALKLLRLVGLADDGDGAAEDEPTPKPRSAHP